MILHLTVQLQVPPHLTGKVPQIPSIQGNTNIVKVACLQAIDTAFEADLFDANGCLTLVIQPARTPP